MLAPLAIGVAYLGGWMFAVFWGIAAIIVMWEWTTLVSGADRRSVLMTGIVAVALAVALAASSVGCRATTCATCVSRPRRSCW